MLWRDRINRANPFLILYCVFSPLILFFYGVFLIHNTILPSTVSRDTCIHTYTYTPHTYILRRVEQSVTTTAQQVIYIHRHSSPSDHTSLRLREGQHVATRRMLWGNPMRLGVERLKSWRIEWLPKGVWPCVGLVKMPMVVVSTGYWTEPFIH
jgi:hypothetical protein